MRKLFQSMRVRLEEFLVQRQNLTLVVKAGPSEYLPIVSTLKGLEEEGKDAFWVFSEPFESAPQYAKVIAENFKTQYAALAPAMREGGADVPESLPPSLLDERRPPVDRLRELMIFARGLIEDLEATNAVFGFVPSKIGAPLPFAQMVLALVAHELPMPWCHHMRIIVCESASQALVFEHGKTMARAEFYAPDLGQAALQTSLEDEANDEALPLPQRMQSLLLLAGMDLAYRRFPAAMEKYKLLADYHEVVGPLPLHALALNGMGEVWDRSNKPVEARASYENALGPAVVAKDLPTMTIIMQNLANLHRTQERWQEAHDHYGALSELAKAMCNPMLQLRCLEQMGFCRYKLGDHKGAWAHWNAGVTLARGVESREHLLDCLERIRSLYKELRMSDRHREVDAEVDLLKRQGVKVYPA
jgi:tetratricopeptide (TPR) repeat protein